MWLGNEPLMYGTKEGIQYMANRTAVGPGELPAGLLKLFLYDDARLSKVHDTMIAI